MGRMLYTFRRGKEGENVKFPVWKFLFAFLRFVKRMNWFLSLLSAFCGITYFVAWSASFYPQTILNYRRKSVVGLSFDYLNYNILGFTCYTIYNLTLFFSPVIQAQYAEKYNTTSIPVDFSDVLFAVHAFILCSYTCFQCFIYDRGGQYISPFAGSLAFLGWFSCYIVALLGGFGVLSWLNVVYWLSYVKLGITFVKYIPQAYMNFRRKSTKGWHIWNVLLDITGGFFSLLQMFINALNEGDWSAFTNYSKLGLSLFSIGFDILFIIQHYICYPPSKSSPEIEDIMKDTSSLNDFDAFPDLALLGTEDSLDSINSSQRSFGKANSLFRAE